MIAGEVVSGERYGWSLQKKLGEGDAGEVYLVESLLEKKVAILKRPHRSAFSSDILRQSAQIENEAKILRAFNRFSVPGKTARLVVPGLLDQSKPGTEFSERFFIIIEKAPGIDLNTLARAAHFGPAGDAHSLDLTAEERIFIDGLMKQGKIPHLVLLRAFSGLLEFLHKIHSYHIPGSGESYGILWNDVKLEHVFWDPGRAGFTIIDWGNGQFLQADGTSKDRLFSHADDYLQFIQEMGKFLADSAPELHNRLAWPEASLSINSAYKDVIAGLQARISDQLDEEMEALREVRQKEELLILSGSPSLRQFQKLYKLHDQIIRYGELPHFSGAETYFIRLAARLASKGRLVEFRQLCEKAARLPGVNLEKWHLLERISDVACQFGESPAQIFIQAILTGLNDDWPAVLWDLLVASQDFRETNWWDELSIKVRQIQPEVDANGLTPLVTVSRLAHTLQAASLRLGDSYGHRQRDAESRPNPGLASELDGDSQVAEPVLLSYENLVRILREEVIKKWPELEPDPPDSGLAYQDIERILADLGQLAPEGQQALIKVLDQPKSQVKIVLDAWERREFETAQRGLRRVLLWDPDRRRVLMAERAIQTASAWMEKVRSGPKRGELVNDFMTGLELEGRELRNQVGPARWLDMILEAFSRLRKGANPADLILERPELLGEIPWLTDYESHRYASSLPGRPVVLERGKKLSGAEPAIQGMQDGALGEKGAVWMAGPLDTWAPEARGSSARVFEGHLRNQAGDFIPCAIKVMRGDRAEYALPLFREEIQVLTMMRDVPGMTGLMECGYIHLEQGQQLPPDDQNLDARDLRGEVQRFGTNDVQNFLIHLERQVEAGWLPYLALECRDREDNLMALCDAGLTRGRFLPLAESLRMAIQICDILQAAHDRHIVYRDHKILHYYWLEDHNGIYIIDWNVARRHPQGLSDTEKQSDMVQFGARALHHIMTGRPAPGALPPGPTRPDEIEQAAHTYHPQWTYDDRRLPDKLKNILERVLAGGYHDAGDLRADLHQIFVQLTGNGR